MGGPSKPPKLLKLPPAADPTKAMLAAMKYAETEKKIRESTGRKSTFQLSPQTFSPGNTVLGA